MNVVLRWILPFLGLLLLVGGGSYIAEIVRGPSVQEIVEEFRIEMEGLRTRVEACLSTRSRIELRFQGHVRRTGELRARVDSLESMDPRGVPSESYEAYLIQVDLYNRAVDEWENLSRELEAHDPLCRELIAAHNALGDSIRLVLEEEGGEGAPGMVRPEEVGREESAVDLQDGAPLPTTVP